MEGHMQSEVIEQVEPKETVAHSLPVSAVRAIEYRAFLDRCNKSEAAARLIAAGAAALKQDTPAVTERRTA
jgi:hypothetical protein